MSKWSCWHPSEGLLPFKNRKSYTKLITIDVMVKNTKIESDSANFQDVEGLGFYWPKGFVGNIGWRWTLRRTTSPGDGYQEGGRKINQYRQIRPNRLVRLIRKSKLATTIGSQPKLSCFHWFAMSGSPEEIVFGHWCVFPHPLSPRLPTRYIGGRGPENIGHTLISAS